MPRRPESVLVVITAPPDETLLLERRSPRGFWQSVTGSLEPGETPLEAARRELAEETGIEAGEAVLDLRSRATFAIAPHWQHRYAPGVTHNLEHHFALALPRRVTPVLQPEEHVDACWMSWEQAFLRVSSWTNRTALLACRAPLTPGPSAPGDAPG